MSRPSCASHLLTRRVEATRDLRCLHYGLWPVLSSRGPAPVVSYKEKFIIRYYEVGINKTANVENMANLLKIFFDKLDIFLI